MHGDMMHGDSMHDGSVHNDGMQISNMHNGGMYNESEPNIFHSMKSIVYVSVLFSSPITGGK